MKSFYKLSTAMDNLRVIYCNVQSEENNGIGYYPFEHVRDIVDIAQFVAPGENGNFAARQKAKAAVIAIFGSLRHSIQSEATSLTPDNPVVYNSPERDRYIRKIGNTTGLDIPKIREQNKAKL